MYVSAWCMCLYVSVWVCMGLYGSVWCMCLRKMSIYTQLVCVCVCMCMNVSGRHVPACACMCIFCVWRWHVSMSVRVFTVYVSVCGNDSFIFILMKLTLKPIHPPIPPPTHPSTHSSAHLSTHQQWLCQRHRNQVTKTKFSDIQVATECVSPAIVYHYSKPAFFKIKSGPRTAAPEPTPLGRHGKSAILWEMCWGCDVEHRQARRSRGLPAPIGLKCKRL